MRLIDAESLSSMRFTHEMHDSEGRLYVPFDEVAEAIFNAPTIEAEPVKHRRWIPVNERLPKQGQEVICQCRARIIKVLKLDADGDWYQDASHCYMRGFVIAWMPLPEPYKGEGEAYETD